MKLSVSQALVRSISGVAFAALALGMPAPSARADDVLQSINLPIEPWTTVAMAKGFLQEEYDKIGTHEIKLLNPGTAELSGAEAAMLDRGGLAIAQRMIYPATVHRANGLDAVLVWVSVPSDEFRTPVLALKDSPYQSVKDLAGQSLGSPRVGCGWTSPKEILDEAGVPLSTRTHQGLVSHESIESSGAVNSALLSGRIAATATHTAIPSAAALMLTGQVKVIGRSPKDGVYVDAAGRVSYFVMREFVDKYPLAVKAFLIARDRTDAWIAQHVDEASEIVARDTRVPLDIAKYEITDPSSFDFMDGEHSADAVVSAIERFQAYYIDHGDDILPDHHLTDGQVQTFVDRRFFAGGQYSVYN